MEIKEKVLLVNTIADLFNETELTPSEVDETLRKAGYDPDTVGQQMAAAARRALEKSKGNI